MPVGRHRHRAPDARSALLHFVEQLGLGAFVGLVFCGDIFVGRADELLVDGVTGKAAMLLCELFVRGGRSGSERAAKADYDCSKLHRCSWWLVSASLLFTYAPAA